MKSGDPRRVRRALVGSLRHEAELTATGVGEASFEASEKLARIRVIGRRHPVGEDGELKEQAAAIAPELCDAAREPGGDNDRWIEPLWFGAIPCPLDAQERPGELVCRGWRDPDMCLRRLRGVLACDAVGGEHARAPRRRADEALRRHPRGSRSAATRA